MDHDIRTLLHGTLLNPTPGRLVLKGPTTHTQLLQGLRLGWLSPYPSNLKTVS